MQFRVSNRGFKFITIICLSPSREVNVWQGGQGQEPPWRLLRDRGHPTDSRLNGPQSLKCSSLSKQFIFFLAGSNCCRLIYLVIHLRILATTPADSN